MIIVSWNCRGLGNTQKIYVSCDLIKNEMSYILLIQETKLKAEDISHTSLGALKHWNYKVEDARGASGDSAHSGIKTP
jgi:exonuclease III